MENFITGGIKDPLLRDINSNSVDIFFVSTNRIAYNLREFYKNFIESCSGYTFYETNLSDVKEKNNNSLFFINFFEEIKILKPKVVLIFGEEVYSLICKKINKERDSFDESLSFYYFEHEGVYYFPIKKYNYLSSLTDIALEDYMENLKRNINMVLKED